MWENIEQTIGFTRTTKQRYSLCKLCFEQMLSHLFGTLLV